MFTSRHHPEGGATLHCDNARIESLISDYQTTGDIRTLATIVDLTQDRARALIKFRKTNRYAAEDELLSDVNFKLIRAVDKFDREKGSAFTQRSTRLIECPPWCFLVLSSTCRRIHHRRLPTNAC